MAFRFKEKVEICKKEEGFSGSYYTATFLAAVGINQCIVRYETRFAQDRTRLLTENVDESDVRPVPPAIYDTNFPVNERVDVYLVHNAWWVGNITRKVEYYNYYVRLDSTGNEMYCPFYRVRLHLEWIDGSWVYPGSGPEDNTGQAGPSEQGSQAGPSEQGSQSGNQ